ncbi:MAG TPA: hypothetical protein PKZ15_10795 [Paludibacteraceae bacterium]|nr:hypothetical protein [Paludibacteraceae bacterium]
MNKEYCAYSGGTSAESAASDMKKFALARPKYVYEHLLEYAGADSMVNLSITSNVPGAVFTMNGERIPSYNGRYYTNYDLNVQAYAPLGYRFVRWETSPSFDSGDTPTVTYSLLNKSSQWRYFNEGKAPAGDWISTGYDDSSWKTGAGRFGYNTSTENSGYNVVLDYGDDLENKYVTAYFRSTFNVSNLSDILQLKGKITFDDGYILYINGKVVDRMNLEDTASYSTLTSTYANDDVRDFSIDKSFVKEGVHTIAVEMHQTVLNSSDLTFDFSISAVSINKTDRTSEVLNVTLEKDQTIEAVFEKIEAPVLPSLVINEVCASSNAKSENSDDYSNYPDWIEIYNKGTETYDLAGMYLSDNKNNPTKSQIPYGYD